MIGESLAVCNSPEEGDMRRVLRNADEVAHFWANRVQDEGRAGNVFFDGAYIYSYGSHFCMARVLPDGGTVVATTRCYSVTTSIHQSLVRSASRHMRTVYCRDPRDSAHSNMQAARDAVVHQLQRAEEARIWKATRAHRKAEALRLAEQANAYLAALPEDERGSEQPIDTVHLEGVREEMEKAAAALRKLREEQALARRRELEDDLTLWRASKLVMRTGLYELPPALRMSEDGSVVQTSHGAEIPVEDARTLWAGICRAIRSGKDYEPFCPGVMVGHYRLARIRADGSVVIGCHDIAYAELERIAAELGYIKQGVAA
jgi:hypothetical protein